MFKEPKQIPQLSKFKLGVALNILILIKNTKIEEHSWTLIQCEIENLNCTDIAKKVWIPLFILETHVSYAIDFLTFRPSVRFIVMYI